MGRPEVFEHEGKRIVLEIKDVLPVLRRVYPLLVERGYLSGIEHRIFLTGVARGGHDGLVLRERLQVTQFLLQNTLHFGRERDVLLESRLIRRLISRCVRSVHIESRCERNEYSS